MSIFGFKKRKGEKTDTCGCKHNADQMTIIQTEKTQTKNIQSPITSIKVLGSGCKSCHALYDNVQAVVKELKMPVEAEYITDMAKIMEYGVISMPALVVNNQVVSVGRILTPTDLKNLFSK